MQALAIFLSILLGVFFYQGHQLTFLIRYNLIIMLFFAFIRVDFHSQVFQKDHLKILGFNLLIPILFFAILNPFSPTLALVAFISGIAPTAAGGPVIADFLKTNVKFVTTSVLLTSPFIALILPILMPYVAGVQATIKVTEVLLPICFVIFCPLLLSIFVKRISTTLTYRLVQLKGIAYYLFLFNVYLASSKASHFLRFGEQSSWIEIGLIAVVITILGLANFLVGEKLVKRENALAGSLGLGRKNTMFSIWVSLTFLNPVIALGPMFYILFHNTFNSWQIYKVNQIKKIKSIS